MSEAKKKDLLGLICIIIGGIFIVAGLVLFILSNHLNLQIKKVEATVIAMYEITQEDGLRHTMVELSYRVGDELMFANYEYPGVLDEETTYLDVYYNIKEPGMVMEGGWSFESLLVLVFGVLILVPGLYLKGIIRTDVLKLTEPEQNAGKITKQIYEAKRQVLEGALPMLASILFIGFGVVMVIGKNGWWPWMFIVVGSIELLYVGWEFIPAAINWSKLSKIDKYKGKVKVYDMEMDGELVPEKTTKKNSAEQNQNVKESRKNEKSKRGSIKRK